MSGERRIPGFAHRAHVAEANPNQAPLAPSLHYLSAMRLRLIAVVGLFAVLAAACGSDAGSGLKPVRDESGSMFFEVPTEWSVLQEADLAGAADTLFVSQDTLDLPVLSRVVFEGSGAAGTTLNPAAASVPVGSAVVRAISSAARDQISRYALAEAVFPYHAQSSAQIVYKQDMSLGDGFDGVQVIVRYIDAVTSNEGVVSLISVTDPGVTKLYSIAIGCEIGCFVDSQATINTIIDSWLVNTR